MVNCLQIIRRSSGLNDVLKNNANKKSRRGRSENKGKCVRVVELRSANADFD